MDNSQEVKSKLGAGLTQLELDSMGHYEQQSDAPESSAEQEKKRNTVKPPRFLTTDDDDGDVDE